MFPVILANMIVQASEINEGKLMANLITIIVRIADVMSKETFDLITELGALELECRERK